MVVRYGKRTGWSTFRKLVRGLCRLYKVYSGTIDAWAKAQLTAEQFATYTTFTGLIGAACNIVNAIPDD